MNEKGAKSTRGINKGSKKGRGARTRRKEGWMERKKDVTMMAGRREGRAGRDEKDSNE